MREPNADEKAILTAAGFKDSIVTGGSMSWWNAASWCLGQGKHLIDVTEIGCYAQGSTLVEAGDTYAYCCKNGQSCQQSSWSGLWSGNTTSNTTEVDKFSDKIVALRKVYGATDFWSASYYGNTSPNSCNVFYVSLNNGTVFFQFGRNLANRLALCE